ncbi:hypothetical protein FISHEDRAFT_34577 [Fistulina hepatica ATCC 64428]|uniref:t-SNARE coiled-coil homology domain-containing protein n=1 Tax=Fistulina hepatica ATCC 64428 TaxID=1128425 RepID=A0A0D7APR1_9AGAR|nr:hypothetical protein FISHEDRAFT_34577 [Fistulina hepatica ATCC 64428]
MSFLRKKDKYAIPEVGQPHTSQSAPPPSYRSNASTYVRSRDGDPYNTPPLSGYNSRLGGSEATLDGPGISDSNALRDKYSRNAAVGDAYSRGGGNVEQDRSELLGGYRPKPGAGSGRFFDGPSIREPAPGEENDEDVEGIKQQTRYVKQESVNSARNALRLAREAEETARGTLLKLGDQSEKLADTERHLDVAKGHSLRAEDKTDELKKLNRSIFRPAITFNKDAKRAAQAAKIEARYDEERGQREKAMMDVRESQNRIGRAASYGDELAGRDRMKTQSELDIRKQQRQRFQFEGTASDDELEDELDDNLDEISAMTKRLKALGTAMGDELDQQNKRVDVIEQKAVGLDQNLFRTTERVSTVFFCLLEVVLTVHA